MSDSFFVTKVSLTAVVATYSCSRGKGYQAITQWVQGRHLFTLIFTSRGIEKRSLFVSKSRGRRNLDAG
jgi:hypothetical protein